MTKPLKILILDDLDEDASLLIRELERSQLSFTYRFVKTRENFKIALSEFNPDIILSDYSMPSFNGLSAFELKNHSHPDTPFIIISGTIGEENAIELIKSGITDYALKDKLFVVPSKINRALKEAEEIAMKKAEIERVRIQHRKLLEIAFLQSHQVRRPVASILGLVSLINTSDPSDPRNADVIPRLKSAALELDEIIHDIIKKTEDILTH
jgi:DNA-binding NtrC family response regulator